MSCANDDVIVGDDVTDLSTIEGPSKSGNKDNDVTKKSKPNLKSNVVVMATLVFYILFNLLGALLFMAIENNSGSPRSHWFAQYKLEFAQQRGITLRDVDFFIKKVELAHSEGAILYGNTSYYRGIPELDLNQAFVLAFTIATTIGYGVRTPETKGGKVFCIFFAFVSIPFTALLAAKLGSIMAYYVRKAGKSCGRRFSNLKRASVVFSFVFGLALYVIMPTFFLLLVGNDEQWTFIDCLYCVIVTLTTIGFGDFVPDPGSEGGIVFSFLVLVWLIAGLSWLAMIINLIAVAMKKKAASLKETVARPSIIRKGKTLTRNIAQKAVRQFSTSQDNEDPILMKVKKSESIADVIEPDGLKCCDVEKSDVTNRSLLGPGSFHAVVNANSDN